MPNLSGFCSLFKYLIFALASLLIACSNGGSGGTSQGAVDPSITPGSLVYLPSTAVSVVAGGSYDLMLDLINSIGVSDQSITLTVDDPSIATVSPSTCKLSSGSITSSECNLIIYGVSAGQTRLVASSSAYTNLSIAITTTAANTINYGSLGVLNGTTDGSQYVSTTPITLNYANGGNQMAIDAKLLGSSNVTADTTITFAPSVGTATPASCSVTSDAPFCQTMITGLPPSGTTPITVSATSTLGSGNTYSSITVNATAPSTPSGPTNGSITIATQNMHSGNQVPFEMNAPIFINWKPNGKSDTATVALTVKNADGTAWSSNSALSLYSYKESNNVVKYQWGATGSSAISVPVGGTTLPLCTLTTNDSTCGYGVVANASSGSVIITGTVSSANGYTYSIEPLQLSAIAVNLADVARSVTFTNNSTEDDIWVGITGGAAAAYTRPDKTAGNVNTNNKSVTAVGANTCGLSAPQNACPMGSTCIQGGANPGTLSNTPFYCYWDQGTPSNGYLIAKGGGGSSTTTLNISKFSLAPGTKDSSPIIWSGNFYARQSCNSTTGACSNATCVGSSQGLACGPGTGATPGINTLAELTFQKSSAATDYYDVSIIGGANYATQFGPTSTGLKTSASDQYICGTAGSTTNIPSSSSGYVADNLSSLPAANWRMGATSSSFPIGNSISNTIAPSYFRVVSGGSGASCSGTGTCSTAGEVCGYNGFGALGIGSTPSYNSQVCGKQLTWVTANSVWAQNKNVVTNTAPFSFAALTAPAVANSVGNYQLCIGTTYTAYKAAGAGSPELACGGVIWGPSQTSQIFNLLTWNYPDFGGSVLGGATATTGLNITQPTAPVNYASAYWLSYVLPTIQWLKAACPTCYTFPFDDMSSTFQCSSMTNTISYGVRFSDLQN